jgi:hypothetical protein
MRKLFFLILCLFLMALTADSWAQCTNPPSSPAVLSAVEGEWRAYAYDGTNTSPNNNDYYGYYIDAHAYGPGKLSFDSSLSYAVAGNPSDAPGFEGCTTLGNNNHSLVYTTIIPKTGNYKMRIQYNNTAQVFKNAGSIFDGTSNQNSFANIPAVTFTQGDKIEVRMQDTSGDSFVQFEMIPEFDFAGVGDGFWECSVYNTSNFTSYQGGFITNELNFNYQYAANEIIFSDLHGENKYVGEALQRSDVNGVFHSYSFKREGFDCGYYQIDLTRHDDAYELLIDDVQVNTATGRSDNPIPNIYTGFLGENTKIEFKISNSGSGSNPPNGGATGGGLTLTRLDAGSNETIWTGEVSTNTNNPANWCPGLPDATTDVYIPDPAYTTNSPVMNADLSVANLRFHADASLDAQAAFRLNVNGTLTTTDSQLVGGKVNELYLGSTNARLEGEGFEVTTLIVNGTATLALNANQEIGITDLVQVNSGSLNTNGQLRLKCQFADLTQRVAQIDDLTNGSITGDVITEQCIPGRRAFRLVTPPVTTSTTIHNNWQQGATAVGDNPKSGYGTHITGSQMDQTNGFDATPSGNPSLFLFDNSNQQWSPIANTNVNTLTAGQGYRLMVRGDRSLDISVNTALSNNTILEATGSVRQGNVNLASELNFSSTADDFNFFGNPYPAAIDMQAVLQNATNLASDYYIWDPNLGGTNDNNQNSSDLGGRGAFVTVDTEQNTNTVAPGTSGFTTSAANRYLQPGQAAFVKSTGGVPNMSIQESYKRVSEPQTDVFRPGAQTRTYVDLILYEANQLQNGETYRDALRLKWNSSYTTLAGVEDASKMGNLDENLAVVNNGKYLAIDRRNYPSQEEIIPLFINQYRHQIYTVVVKRTEWENMELYWVDNYLNTETLIDNDIQFIHFSVDANLPASIAAQRFALKVKPSSLGISDMPAEGFSMYPNPLNQDYLNFVLPAHLDAAWTVKVFDMLGKKVMEEHATAKDQKFSMPANQLKTGVYLIQLQHTSSQKQFTQKLVVH